MARDLDAIHLQDMGIEDEVVKLRDEEEMSWAAISEQLGVAPGKAMFAYMKATVPKKEVVKGDFDVRSAAVVSLRDEGQLSWGQIAVRVDLPPSRVLSVYEELTGTSTKGLRLEGKGGRHPNGEAPEPKAPKAKKVAGEKAAPAPKATATKTKSKPLAEMDLAELKARLEGATIEVTRGSKTQRIKVKTVKSVADGVIEIVNAENGGSHTIKLSAIVKASGRAKVAA